MSYEEIISRFEIKSGNRAEGKVQCLCPAHSDKKASLTISKGKDGKTLVHCHAGCSTEAVLSAVGLSLKDLYEEDLHGEPYRMPEEKWKRYLEALKNKNEDEAHYRIKSVYHYTDLEGNYQFSKVRFAPKSFLCGVIIDGKIDLKKSKMIKDAPAIYCPDLNGFYEAIVSGATVFYCEGEKDVDILTERGYPAITCGSAMQWDHSVAPIFKDANLIVIADNDSAGISMANEIVDDLSFVVKKSKVVVPMPEMEKGDISDFFDAGFSNEDFDSLCNSVKAPLNLDQFHKFDKQGHPKSVLEGIVADHIKENYNIIVIKRKDYIYHQGCFVRDDDDGTELKQIIKGYIYPEIRRADIIGRIYRLVIEDHDLVVAPENVNQYPVEWICFLNGMYDPITKQMHPHDPKYKAINQIPHTFDPSLEIEGPEIGKWLAWLAPNDDIEMLLQFLGYCMTRDVRQQKFLLLWGEGGTGKSILIRLVEAMVGCQNISNISLHRLQNNRFASFGLLNKLLNTCADIASTALDDTETIKQLLGEDKSSVEPKGVNAFTATTYSKFLFSTNNLPLVNNERTVAFYRRLMILPMNKKPPEGGRADFYECLAREIDYFISLCVKALERMYAIGKFTESENSRKAVARLRYDSDSVAAFLMELVEKEESARPKRVDVFAAYETFCWDYERKALTKHNFYRAMRAKGIREVKTDGFVCFKGIKLKNRGTSSYQALSETEEEDKGFVEIRAEETPFE